MIGLTTVNDSLEMVTGQALSTDYFVTYVDTTSTLHTPGSGQGNVSTATTTTILSAPAASTYRGVKALTVVNKGSSPQTITIQKDVSATNYVLCYATLMPSEMLMYAPEIGFVVMDRAGRPRANTLAVPSTIGDFVEVSFQGTPAEAASYHYCASKDGGHWWGPWSPGTSGVNGRATDGTASADYGCVPLQNAPSGYQKYLASWAGQANVSNNGYYLFDCLWVNDGLVVTTTTAQAITTPTFPARDADGSTNGRGLKIGLLITATTGNAGAISGATVDYTNSEGTASRTATLVASNGYQIPATAIVGTLVWFKLQTGDLGVRSIQGITLGTSLVSGSISLLVGRNVAHLPLSSTTIDKIQYAHPGVRIFDGACLLPAYKAANTTAVDFQSTVQFVDL